VDSTRAVDAILIQLDQRRPLLGANLVQFAALLKAAEIDVSTTQVLRAAQALDAIDISQREDARYALAAALLSRIDERETFDLLFDRFWRVERPEGEPPRPEPERLEGGEPRLGTAEEVDVSYVRQHVSDRASSGDTPPRSYSGDDALLRKDFATFRDDEVREARRHLRLLAPKLATATSRRRRTTRTGPEIDLRRSLRRAARHGEVLDLLRRRRRVRRLNLVLLCDVSGSMDVYARFLAQFLYGLQQELRGVSTFVFSTRLFEITPMLRARDFDEALARVSRSVDAWSGGTRIGACLAEFNRRYGKERLGPRTAVVIISDGWDRGDIMQLDRELGLLKRRSYRLLWLNPLLGASDYKPVAQGMSTALRYVDDFLPVHNIESLSRVGRKIMSLARR
jgi:uncharacterized protein with von Willebrand factor type A (vWA) domain